MFNLLNQSNPIDIVATLSVIITIMALAQIAAAVAWFMGRKRNAALERSINDLRDSTALIQRSLEQTRQEFHIRELYGNYNNNYLQAIETARRGSTLEEIMFRHGLGEAEAKLILQSHRPNPNGAH